MSISSELRSLFASKAVTPRTNLVSSGNITSSTFSNNEETELNVPRQLVPTSQYTMHNSFNYFFIIIRAIARLFTGAVCFTIAGHFVPELPEKIPSFYLFVDTLMNWLEFISSYAWNIIF